MQTPFSDCEQAVRDIAIWEKHRIEFAIDEARRGFRIEPDSLLLGGWQWRAILLAKTSDILKAMAPLEQAIRALVPALGIPERAIPSLWEGCSLSTEA